jgi:hypothetical protein
LDLAENEGAPLYGLVAKRGTLDGNPATFDVQWQLNGEGPSPQVLRLYHLAGTPNLTEALLLGTVPGI